MLVVSVETRRCSKTRWYSKTGPKNISLRDKLSCDNSKVAFHFGVKKSFKASRNCSEEVSQIVWTVTSLVQLHKRPKTETKNCLKTERNGSQITPLSTPKTSKMARFLTKAAQSDGELSRLVQLHETLTKRSKRLQKHSQNVQNGP